MDLEQAVRALCASVKDWPEVDGEPLDTENFDVLQVVVRAGGDWQDAHLVFIDVEDRTAIRTIRL